MTERVLAESTWTTGFIQSIFSKRGLDFVPKDGDYIMRLKKDGDHDYFTMTLLEKDET